MSVQEIRRILDQYASFPNQLDPRVYRTFGLILPVPANVADLGATMGVAGGVYSYSMGTGGVTADLFQAALAQNRMSQSPGWIVFALLFGNVASGFATLRLQIDGANYTCPTQTVYGSGAYFVGARNPMVRLYNGSGNTYYFTLNFVYIPQEYSDPDIGAQTNTPMEAGK